MRPIKVVLSIAILAFGINLKAQTEPPNSADNGEQAISHYEFAGPDGRTINWEEHWVDFKATQFKDQVKFPKPVGSGFEFLLKGVETKPKAISAAWSLLISSMENLGFTLVTKDFAKQIVDKYHPNESGGIDSTWARTADRIYAAYNYVGNNPMTPLYFFTSNRDSLKKWVGHTIFYNSRNTEIVTEGSVRDVIVQFSVLFDYDTAKSGFVVNVTPHASLVGTIKNSAYQTSGEVDVEFPYLGTPIPFKGDAFCDDSGTNIELTSELKNFINKTSK